MHDEQPGQDQLLTAASLWFARMRGPDADTFRPAFEKWLARGASHLGAYNRAAEIFNMGKFLAEPGEGLERDAAARPARRRWPIAMLVASTILVAMVAFWLSAMPRTLLGFGDAPEFARVKGKPAPAPVRLVTAPGPDRTFTLADGSRVTLVGGSALSVTFSAGERALRLDRGRGRFDVAHEPRRFVVYAGGGRVTAHGTIFDVAIDSRHRVTVSLLRGSIDVALPEKTPAVRRLAPGQTVSFSSSETPVSLARREAGTASPGATMPEMAEFDEVKLADLIAAANQHDGPRLVLADPALGELRVSGRFSVADPAKLAERVAGLLDLVIDRRNVAQIVLRRR